MTFERRSYPLLREHDGWRLRSRSRKDPVDFRTGTHNFREAVNRAKAHLEKRATDPVQARQGRGTLEGIAMTYLATQEKKCTAKVAADNVGALRGICRLALGRELAEVKCAEIGPALWTRFQEAALRQAGFKFDRTTRRRINTALNSRLRRAASVFLDRLRPVYEASGFLLPSDSGRVVLLPEIYIPQSEVDDAEILKQWAPLRETDLRLWLTIGLGRFAGLRKEEVAGCAAGWIKDGGIELRDREEEGKWTKTGQPYSAPIIEPEFARWLTEFAAKHPAGQRVVDASSTWFATMPQRWLRSIGVTGNKPFHRLRSLYAQAHMALAKEAIEAKAAALKATSKALGHTTTKTTRKHYV